jgi:hypothetical protein
MQSVHQLARIFRQLFFSYSIYAIFNYALEIMNKTNRAQSSGKDKCLRQVSNES